MERSSPKSSTQPRRRSRHSVITAAIAKLAGIEADLASLQERARLAQEELERADHATSDDTYDNAPGGANLPLHVSDENFRRRCNRIPEAWAVGKTKAKVWTCPREAWHRHAERPTLARTSRTTSSPVNSDDAAADAMLAAVGLRATSGSGR